MWITISLAALFNVFLSSPISVALPFFIKDNLHADVGALGLVFSAFSIGSIVGAVGIGRARKLRRRGLLTYLAWMIGALMISAFGLASSVATAVILSFLAGIGLTVGQLLWTNILQELVPTELLGRVSSVDQFGSFILLPVGYGLTGWLTSQIGAPLVFIIGGCATAFLLLLGLLHPGVRNLE